MSWNATKPDNAASKTERQLKYNGTQLQYKRNMKTGGCQLSL
jgi:hypothetical protein